GQSGDQPLPGAIRLLNGEVWRAGLQNVEGVGHEQSIGIQSKTLGTRKVPLASLASMEFVAGGPDAPREPGTLYRIGGEPIPGKLVWVRQKDIALDCALGVIPLPRQSVERFVLARARPAPPESDTIGLTDGSLLYGQTGFDGSQLVVNHETLGELRLDWNVVRYLRRHVAGIDWLEQLAMTVVERVGPALPPPVPRWHEGHDHDHRRAVRIMPNTVVRFALKTGPQRSGLFRSELAAVPGCRADLKVSVLAGEATLWQQRVAAGSAPIPLSLELPDAGELTIEVEFDGPLAFPCGIDLRDPHVLNLAHIQSQPQTKKPN
nr:hypothetical protein [Akkermansiaceae bacterium]